MAARKTAAAVGSVAWIANERLTIQQLEEQDIEDIAYAVRNDIDWLNEHMANIFERNIFDMAEIMKTPGRLRGKTPGKTPRTVRKPFAVTPAGSREKPRTDMFASTPLVNRLQETVAESSNKQSTPPIPAQPQFLHSPHLGPENPLHPSPIRSPVRSSPRKQPTPRKADSPTITPVKEVVIRSRPPPSSEVAPIFPDSGFFTSPNPDSQVDAAQDKPSGSHGSTGSRTSAGANTGRQGRSSELSVVVTARNSFNTAQEDVSFRPPSSPVDEVGLVRANSTERQVQQGEPQEDVQQPEPVLPKESPARRAQSPKKVKETAVEPRRSGRLAVRASEPLEQELPVPEAAVASSPPKASATAEDGPAFSTLPETKEVEVSPFEALHTNDTTQSFDTTQSKSPSAPPTPEAPVMRQSNMSFASLPAREPLTSKKKSSGVKAIRESQLDQLEQNGVRGAGWTKKGNGKSLGGSSRSIIRQEEEEQEEEGQKVEPKEMEVVRGEEDEEERPRTGEKRKSEGTSTRWRKMSKGEDEMQETIKIPTKLGDGELDAELRLHNKTSTQRLHDRIQQLGKLNARTARSFPAPTPQPSVAYPDLSSQEVSPISVSKVPTPPVEKRSEPETLTRPAPAEMEDILYVRSPKPQHTRSKTEGSILANVVPGGATRRQSPRGPSPVKTQAQASPIVSRAVDTAASEMLSTAVQSPGGRSALSPSSSLKTTVLYASINDVPQFAANGGASTPKKTPTADNSLSAVKGHTSTMLKKAKEMWMKNLAANASAKVEAVSSPPALRKWQGAESLQDVFKRDATPNRTPEQPQPRDDLYPNLATVAPMGSADKGKEREDEATAPQSSVVDVPQEGRQTRDSRTRVEEAAREAGRSATPTTITPTVVTPTAAAISKDEEIKAKLVSSERQAQRSNSRDELQNDAAAPEPAPESKLKKKKSAYSEDAEMRVLIERKRRLEEILERERDDRRRLEQQEEERRLKEQQAPAPVVSEDEEPVLPESSNRSRFGSAEPERPASRLQQRGMRFQKLEPKRVVRTTKDQPAVKPAPVAMKISTASQREMQDQRLKNTVNATGPSSSALVSALKNSFEPAPPAANPNPAPPQSLHTSSSNGSLRSLASSTANTSSTKRLKSLQSAASQRKKEQEEKDKKAAQKRELEKRRAEHTKRQEEEHKRMQAQRQKATTPGPSSAAKPLARAPQTNSRQTSQEPEANRGKIYGSLNKVPYGGTIKRTLTQDSEDQQQQNRLPSRPGTAASYHQDGQKKRRTNDHEEQRAYEMPPPIRASMAKKELVPKVYGQASSVASSSSSSSMKPPGSRVPQIDSVKYSSDKLWFAGDTSGQSAASSFKTPTTKARLMNKTPAGFKESPLYPNGESIELPEIPTDSEDDDDGAYPGKKNDFHVPQWAESPHLPALLRRQQTMDPAEIFGPMAKLDMDAIFQSEKTGKFRARTSSANWAGADRLTQAEIIADQEARRKMMETGKWVPPGL